MNFSNLRNGLWDSQLHGTESFVRRCSLSSTQEFPNILWNLIGHYRQINLVHTKSSISLGSISTVSAHLYLGIPNYLFPPGFPSKIPYAITFFPCMLHAIPPHPLQSCIFMKMTSSGMLNHVALISTDVLEDCSTSMATSVV
jgi:hypothetical protein